MKVTHKKTEDGGLRIEAIATPGEVEDAYIMAHIAFARQMNLQPEKDKTVAQVVEEKMGIKDLDSIVTPQAVEYLLPFALDKKNTIPAYPPQPVSPAPMKRGAEYRFTLDVAEKPEYELKSYDPVAITVPPFEIDEAEVEAQLAQMAEQSAEYVTDDPHPVRSGDSVLLAMETFEDGKPLPGLTTDSRTYTTGGGFMPDGFDENIIGMEPGQTKTFTFSGPSVDENGKEIEQIVECTATVKEIQKRIIPAITDAWVEKNMPMMNGVEALKNAIRERITAARSSEYENFKRQLAVSELAKRFEGKIDDPVYEAMQQNILNNLRAQLNQQNIPFEQFVEQNGGEQQFSMSLMMQTRQSLTEGYSLDAVFRHEKMTLTEADILDVCKELNPQQPEVIKEQMEKTGRGYALRETASRLKASKWLVEQAAITVQAN
ncbi:MAG TPA: trigger factor [Coriobacteriia bacterium]|nr:trigger factor [Coriobacteriia bacterium]